MNKEPIRHSTPATIEPSVWRTGVKLPRYPFRFAPSFAMASQTMAGLIAAGVMCLGLAFVTTLSFVEAMALALIGTALILLSLGDRANTRIAPLSIYGMNPHATQRVPCVVILTVDGFELWRDMGVVGFDDVRLVYAGLRTSFSLRPENLFGGDPSDQLIRGFRKIRLRLPGQTKVVLEIRPFERFIERDLEDRRRLCHELVRTARDNAISRPAACGSLQWPPLDNLTRTIRQIEAATDAKTWLTVVAICLGVAALWVREESGSLVVGCILAIRLLVGSRVGLAKLRAYTLAREKAEDPASLPGKV